MWRSRVGSMGIGCCLDGRTLVWCTSGGGRGLRRIGDWMMMGVRRGFGVRWLVGSMQRLHSRTVGMPT
ncbi:hypothetical protein BDZ97DRAFT_1823025 [Flammula alnicola]|nr:hypothetical protein BDZ97DRAFT_1823025 [Flammula alnicola]